MFGLFFVGHSGPITSNQLTQVDATHWVLDCAPITSNYTDLKEVALFLLPGTVIDPNSALGLYVKAGASGQWSYRGCVHNGHPSEVMPLQWPLNEDGSPVSPAVGPIQIGVSVEPGEQIIQKEGSKVGAKEEFAKRVGLDLFRFLESFQTQQMGNHIVVPADALDRWFVRFSEKFRRDPDFLTRRKETF
ncbi:hypothetical protein Agub_g14568 [Astrephomene gubernaculifera]|uniref:Hikeshi-like domain-containing protein n=1 Tax=Astrephomene gubernaculifera TaxID=47775 RepID=A0AAD3E1T3_9CHLO|nr:hypothetical protein Agub_g14568 [Astrephomene gubernaculifera]